MASLALQEVRRRPGLPPRTLVPARPAASCARYRARLTDDALAFHRLHFRLARQPEVEERRDVAGHRVDVRQAPGREWRGTLVATTTGCVEVERRALAHADEAARIDAVPAAGAAVVLDGRAAGVDDLPGAQVAVARAVAARRPCRPSCATRCSRAWCRRARTAGCLAPCRARPGSGPKPSSRQRCRKPLEHRARRAHDLRRRLGPAVRARGVFATKAGGRAARRRARGARGRQVTSPNHRGGVAYHDFRANGRARGGPARLRSLGGPPSPRPMRVPKGLFAIVKEVARHLLRRPVVGIAAAARTARRSLGVDPSVGHRRVGAAGGHAGVGRDAPQRDRARARRRGGRRRGRARGHRGRLLGARARRALPRRHGGGLRDGRASPRVPGESHGDHRGAACSRTP